jgi:hypothetical protein
LESARYDDAEPVLTLETFEKAHRLFIPARA